jgi:hypothetical protein
VPDESTVRTLTRRLGAETVAALSRSVLAQAQREPRVRARAVRIDSTVVEAEVRDPTDAGLAGDGGGGAGAGGQAAAGQAGRDGGAGAGSLAGGRNAPARALAHAAAADGRGEGGAARADRGTGKLVAASAREAGALAADRAAAGAGAGPLGKAEASRTAAGILAGVERLETLAERSEKRVEQIRTRPRGEPIEDRRVSIVDPDARPLRTRKQGRPSELGDVEQLAEVTPHTKRGARGFILPPASAPGNPGENELLPQTVAELQRLGLAPSEVALDGGFQRRRQARRRSPRLRPSAPSSLGAPRPARNAPGDGSPAIESAPRAGPRTRNAATACAAAARKAARASAPGRAGPCSPPTSRPTPCTPERTTTTTTAARNTNKGEAQSRSYFPPRDNRPQPALIRGK